MNVPPYWRPAILRPGHEDSPVSRDSAQESSDGTEDLPQEKRDRPGIGHYVKVVRLERPDEVFNRPRRMTVGPQLRKCYNLRRLRYGRRILYIGNVVRPYEISMGIS
jgi:hypothetical protein